MTEFFIAILLYIIMNIIISKIIYKGKLKRLWIYPMLGAAFDIIYILCEPYEIPIYFFNIAAFICMGFTLGKSEINKVKNIIIAFGLWSVCDLILNMLYVFCKDYNIIACAASELFIVLCVYGFLKTKLTNKKSHYKSEKTIYMLFCAEGCMIAFIAKELQIFSRYVTDTAFYVINALTLISIISLGFLIVIFIYEESVKREIKKAFKQEKLFMEMQKIYYDKCLKAEEDTKKFRHDIAGHMACISSMAKSRDYNDLKVYMESLEYNVHYLNSNIYSMGNKTADIIANYYLGRLGENITVAIDGALGENIVMEEFDICTIYSNIFKNILDELESSSEKGFVNIVIESGGQITRVTVENSLSYRGKKSEGEHYGYGLQNIKSILEKYNGSMNSEKTTDKYIIVIKYYER